MKVVIVTGLSGAGKTKAADWFEDQGYYCIDNMPPQLIRNFLELLVTDLHRIEKVALVADVRAGDFFESLEMTIDDIRKMDGVETKVVFIEASNNTIIRRYNETRRTHPLSAGKATGKVVDEERAILDCIKKKADFVIDTTGMRGAAFEHQLSRLFLGAEGKTNFNINITSFGYKYGIPAESDITIDMRFIPNPFYVESLRNLTGNNKKVSRYVLKQEVAQEFIKEFHSLVNHLIPGYIQEGKYHLNIAFGCTGGHHRSVAVANEMARIFEGEGRRVAITHRDLDFVSRK